MTDPTIQERIDAAMACQACTDDLNYVPYQDPERTFSEEEADRQAYASLRRAINDFNATSWWPTHPPRNNIIQGPWT